MNEAGRQLLRRIAPPVVVLAAALAAWEAGVRLTNAPPLVLPRPSLIAAAAWRDGPQLLQAAGLTAAAALLGLGASLAVGLVLAAAFARWPLVRRGCYPYAVLLQTTPIVAIAPLVIVALGFGFRSVVVVAFCISLFPILANGTAGLRQADPGLVDFFRLHGARWRQEFFKLRLPGAVRSLAVGARTASGLAVVGAIVGEFFVGYAGSSQSLGVLIVKRKDSLQTPELFAAVGASALLGVAMFALVSLVSATLLARWTRA